MEAAWQPTELCTELLTQVLGSYAVSGTRLLKMAVQGVSGGGQTACALGASDVVGRAMQATCLAPELR